MRVMSKIEAELIVALRLEFDYTFRDVCREMENYFPDLLPEYGNRHYLGVELVRWSAKILELSPEQREELHL